MEKLSLLGIALALVAIFGGHWLGGGHIDSLIQGTALLIVLGGTASAIMLQTPHRVLLRGLRMVRQILRPVGIETEALIQRLVEYAKIARRDGFLALEPHLVGQRDPFQRKALELLIDGIEAEELRQTLQIELDTFGQRELRAARIWEAAGAYSPTIGILGAVMGLIHVMENLSDPSRLGGGIAVAFVATLYGVGLANLLFLPIANRLKARIAAEVQVRRMLIEGFCGVALGNNPRLVERRMQGYVEP